MNKKFFFAALLFVFTFSSAAIAQDWFAGISAHYTFTREKLGSDTLKRTEFSIKPLIGHVLNEEWDAGAEIEIASVLDYSRTIGVSPFVRYSLAAFEKFELLAVIQCGYAYTAYDGDHDGLHAVQVGVFPQLEYRMTESVSWYARMGGAIYKYSKGGISTSTTSVIDLKLNTENLFLGVLFHFDSSETESKPEQKKAPDPKPSAPPQPGVKR